jgi:hypothetical protein
MYLLCINICKQGHDARLLGYVWQIERDRNLY